MFTESKVVRVGTFEAIVDIKNSKLEKLAITADTVGGGTNQLILKGQDGTDHEIADLLEMLYYLQKELEHWL